MTKLDYRQEVEINGKKVRVIGGSPTSTFKSDLIAEMTATTPTLAVGHITTITLMSGTTERDNVSVSFVWVTISEDKKKVAIKGSGTFTASASYTCDRIRAKTATGKIYFETSISPVSITAGLVYNVSWTLTITASRGSRSGWCSDAYRFECVGDAVIYRFLKVLAEALGSNRSAFPSSPSLTPTDFIAANDYMEDMLTNKSISKTYSGTTVTITASGVVKTGLYSYLFLHGMLREGRGNTNLFFWNMVNKTVRAGDVIQLQMTVTV